MTVKIYQWMLKLVKVWGEAGYLHSLKIPSSKKYNWKEKKMSGWTQQTHLNPNDQGHQQWCVTSHASREGTSLLRHAGQSCRTSNHEKNPDKPLKCSTFYKASDRQSSKGSRSWTVEGGWGPEEKSETGGLGATAAACCGAWTGSWTRKRTGWESQWKPQRLCALVTHMLQWWFLSFDRCTEVVRTGW